MGVLTGKTDEQEHIEWDELRARAAIEAPLRKRIAELEAAVAAYADPAAYISHGGAKVPVLVDGGEYARHLVPDWSSRATASITQWKTV